MSDPKVQQGTPKKKQFDIPVVVVSSGSSSGNDCSTSGGQVRVTDSEGGTDGGTRARAHIVCILTRLALPN